MNQLFKATALLAALGMSGCATYSSNMRVGNDMSYASLGDQRTASQTIQVLQEIPSGGVDLGEVDAGRCHRSFVESGPAEQTVLLDLKIAAYVLGADAIANESGNEHMTDLATGARRIAWRHRNGQLVKLANSRDRRSWSGKLYEAIVAWKLERRWSKQRIREFIVEHTGRTVASLKRAGRIDGEVTPADETTIHYALDSPEDVMLICAGSTIGALSMVMPGFGSSKTAGRSRPILIDVS